MTASHPARIVRGADRDRISRVPPLPDIQHLVDASTGARSLAIWRNWLASGQRIPAHRHEMEEVLVLVAGACTVQVGGTSVDLEAGDAVVVPPGTPHAVTHRGSAETVIVAALAHPDPEAHTFPC